MQNYDLEWAKAHSIREHLGYPFEETEVQTLLKRNTGQVNLLFMAWNESYGETISGDTVVFVIDGEVGITIGENCHLVRRNNFILIPSNSPFLITAIQSSKLISIILREYENVSF